MSKEKKKKRAYHVLIVSLQANVGFQTLFQSFCKSQLQLHRPLQCCKKKAFSFSVISLHAPHSCHQLLCETSNIYLPIPVCSLLHLMQNLEAFPPAAIPFARKEFSPLLKAFLLQDVFFLNKFQHQTKKIENKYCPSQNYLHCPVQFLLCKGEESSFGNLIQKLQNQYSSFTVLKETIKQV